jgi:hypothetical protein
MFGAGTAFSRYAAGDERCQRPRLVSVRRRQDREQLVGTGLHDASQRITARPQKTQVLVTAPLASSLHDDTVNAGSPHGDAVRQSQSTWPEQAAGMDWQYHHASMVSPSLMSQYSW